MSMQIDGQAVARPEAQECRSGYRWMARGKDIASEHNTTQSDWAVEPSGDDDGWMYAVGFVT